MMYPGTDFHSSTLVAWLAIREGLQLPLLVPGIVDLTVGPSESSAVQVQEVLSARSLGLQSPRPGSTEVLSGKSLEVLWEVRPRVLGKIFGCSRECFQGCSRWGDQQEEHPRKHSGAPRISLSTLASTSQSTSWDFPDSTPLCQVGAIASLG